MNREKTSFDNERIEKSQLKRLHKKQKRLSIKLLSKEVLDVDKKIREEYANS